LSEFDFARQVPCHIENGIVDQNSGNAKGARREKTVLLNDFNDI
jgi:hypothetical protein